MNQKELIERALQIVEPVDEEDSLDVAIHGVLKATHDVKKWEAEEDDASECECEQCVATVNLAKAIIEIGEGWKLE